jgi:hypothetical protein
MTDFRALCAELFEIVEDEYSGTFCLMELRSRARTALAQPEPQVPTQKEAVSLYSEVMAAHDCQTLGEMAEHFARAVLARWGRFAIEPVPVSERFEFSVLDGEYEEQAGGTATTYSQALSEGQHYLAMYSQDGPHSLELRRVEVLPHWALPVPQPEAHNG